MTIQLGQKHVQYHNTKQKRFTSKEINKLQNVEILAGKTVITSNIFIILYKPFQLV